ncbi:uncharacterized protein LOC133523122 [Cydia pomonella]|uniref:uncharacterized protein LOC133523122 n=1 Tax=Cydia pomonella TaxID=82600 RepID=UPI002ADD5FAE|nr:uncharacterized protein LOC133523122 [Cydia pomonella]
MSFCGGSVIAVNKVLTAAHCVTDDGNICDKLCKTYKIRSLMKLFVVAGTLRNRARYQRDDQGTEQWRRMTYVTVPNGYWFPKNDISVAYIDFPFVFNAYVQPLPLASRNIEYGSMECLASGWGRINKRLKGGSDILLWAYLRLIPGYRCSRIHKQNMNKFICTASDVTSILEGDSGGPLVCRNTRDPNDRGQGVIVGVACGYRKKGFRHDAFFTRVPKISRRGTSVKHKCQDTTDDNDGCILKVSLKTPIGRGSYMSFCGGSVITENKILSAAHCLTKDGNVCEKMCKKFKKRSLMKLYVVAGTLRNRAVYQRDAEGTEQWRKMKNVIIPRGYWFPKNDICVAFTDAPFVFNEYVKPLPPASNYRDYGSMECLASGWGRINERQTSDILLWAKLRLIPSHQCSRIHRQDMGKFICTESDVTNVLQGDSGGPLVCRGTGDPNDKGQGVIVGVVSGARIRKYSRRYDTFFTRVSSYVKFLSLNEATITTPVFCIVLLSQIISNFN